MYSKIFIVTLTTIFIGIAYSYSCYAANLDMKIYCSRTSRVGFPATGVGENINNKHGNPGYDETYQYQDGENFVAYQFFLKRIESKFKNRYYLDGIANAKIESLKARLTSKNIYEVDGKLIIDYSYEYFMKGLKKVSYTRTVIENDLYYSWSVQTYEGYGNYISKYIFDNYVRYVGNIGKCN